MIEALNAPRPEVSNCTLSFNPRRSSGIPVRNTRIFTDPTISLRLFAECTAISTAEGYPPAEHVREREAGRLSQLGSTFTASMMRDIESGAPVEAQQVLGDLLAYGRKHGLSTPLLEVAFTHVRCYEERRKRSWVPDGRRMQ